MTATTATPQRDDDQISTRYGELRIVTIDGLLAWKLKCPSCGMWGELDTDQMFGRVSVDHTDTGCTYHETHDFANAVLEVEAGCAWAVHPKHEGDIRWTDTTQSMSAAPSAPMPSSPTSAESAEATNPSTNEKRADR